MVWLMNLWRLSSVNSGACRMLKMFPLPPLRNSKITNEKSWSKGGRLIGGKILLTKEDTMSRTGWTTLFLSSSQRQHPGVPESYRALYSIEQAHPEGLKRLIIMTIYWALPVCWALCPAFHTLPSILYSRWCYSGFIAEDCKAQCTLPLCTKTCWNRIRSQVWAEAKDCHIMSQCCIATADSVHSDCQARQTHSSVCSSFLFILSLPSASVFPFQSPHPSCSLLFHLHPSTKPPSISLPTLLPILIHF